MANGNARFSETSVSLKIGAVLLFVCFIVHVIGFTVSRWATIKFSVSTDDTVGINGINAYYHAGLWQHCGCVDIGTDVCACQSRSGDPAWFKIVQTTETLALIGLIISGVTTVALICYKKTMVMKNFNLFALAGSGICIVIGLILFGVEMSKDIKEIFDILEGVDNLDTDGSLSTSFVLCAVAAGICLFACLPLFVIDHRTPISQAQQQAPVYFSNQGQILAPPSGQVPVVVGTTAQPPMGYMPTYMYGQTPPPYESQATPGQYGTPFPQQPYGVQYKA